MVLPEVPKLDSKTEEKLLGFSKFQVATQCPLLSNLRPWGKK